MRRFVLLILFSQLFLFVRAQSYAIVEEDDGYVNVRKSKNIHSSIVGKIYNNYVFSYDDEDKANWIEIFKQEKNVSLLEGYVYKNKIFPLSRLKSIGHIRHYKDSTIAFNDSLKITIKSKPFDYKNHKLTYSKLKSYGYKKRLLEKIDDKPFWGTDGEIPKERISSLKVFKNGNFIVIPKTAFHDLFEPKLNTLKVYLDKNNIIYIEMDNSDGAGAYSIIWIIKNDKLLDSYIDNTNV